jgi:LysM repeat protein
MHAIRILTPSLLAAALVACTPQKNTSYDTPPIVSPAATAQPNPALTNPANPVYDTPAAYEESTATTPAPDVPGIAADPAAAPAANGAAIIHTVGKGDTLSGISAKYKVPAASIKQANRMTNDTVILGRKMVIPPR